MLVFFFDGSYEGVFSAVYDAYTTKRFPELLLKDGDIPPLMTTETQRVLTRADKAERVQSGLERRISPEGRDDLMRVWLAETPGCADLLFRYLRYIFDTPEGQPLEYMQKSAYAVRELARKVSAEAHSLEGFVRFQKTAQGVYFSAVSPRYNVVPLMLATFADRMADCEWILYDHGRAYGVHHSPGKRFSEVSLDTALSSDGRLDASLLAEDEIAYQDLWRRYFHSAAVPERANPRLHARCLPRRFWKYLTEKQQ